MTGRAKQRRAALALGVPWDEDCHLLMEDIPLPVPTHFEGNIQPDLAHDLFQLAGTLRRDGNKHLKSIESDPLFNLTKGILEVLLSYVLSGCDQVINDAVAGNSSRRQLRIDCGKGCSACCHINVEVSIPEAILVAMDVGQAEDPRRATIKETVDAVAGLSDMARSRTGLPCPFLTQDGACSVYQRRPIACRTYLSPDRERCHRALKNAIAGTGDDTAASHGFPQLIGSAHRAAMAGICKDHGLQHDYVDLANAVASIIQGPQLIERWASGEHVFVSRSNKE
jgi:Fe-S-cluster containining protein